MEHTEPGLRTHSCSIGRRCQLWTHLRWSGSRGQSIEDHNLAIKFKADAMIMQYHAVFSNTINVNSTNRVTIAKLHLGFLANTRLTQAVTIRWRLILMTVAPFITCPLEFLTSQRLFVFTKPTFDQLMVTIILLTYLIFQCFFSLQISSALH